MHLGFPKKEWKGRIPHLKIFEDVATYLRKRGHKIVILGGIRDRCLNSDFIDVRCSSISTTVAILRRCKFTVCVDSAVSNLAMLERIPSVIFFGSVNPNYRIWHLNRHRYVWVKERDVYCRGCYHWSHKDIALLCQPKCIAGTELCLSKITHRDFITQIERLNI